MPKSITESTDATSSVELRKGSKGDYSWTVKIYGDDTLQIVDMIDATNEKLEQTYGGEKQ